VHYGKDVTEMGYHVGGIDAPFGQIRESHRGGVRRRKSLHDRKVCVVFQLRVIAETGDTARVVVVVGAASSHRAFVYNTSA